MSNQKVQIHHAAFLEKVAEIYTAGDVLASPRWLIKQRVANAKAAKRAARYLGRNPTGPRSDEAQTVLRRNNNVFGNPLVMAAVLLENEAGTERKIIVNPHEILGKLAGFRQGTRGRFHGSSDLYDAASGVVIHNGYDTVPEAEKSLEGDPSAKRGSLERVLSDIMNNKMWNELVEGDKDLLKDYVIETYSRIDEEERRSGIQVDDEHRKLILLHMPGIASSEKERDGTIITPMQLGGIRVYHFRDPVWPMDVKNVSGTSRLSFGEGEMQYFFSGKEEVFLEA